MQTLIPVEGETSLILSDGDDHARRRKVVQPRSTSGRSTSTCAS